MIPYQIRIQNKLLEKVKASAKINSEGNVNREIRDLIKIGLKNRVGSPFYCQSQIEGEEICCKQCAHCEHYYKPLEKTYG